MKNFEEITEKCLNGELSGTFVCNLGGEIIKISSNNLFRHGETCYRINYPYPHTYDIYNKFGVTEMRYGQVINFIPDMKQNDKRTIQISLQQAREWYNSGNYTLRTLALSSFSKEELDPYPRNWAEYLQRHPENQKMSLNMPNSIALGFMNYATILLLRQEWIHIWSQEKGLKEDWKPDWSQVNYCVAATNSGMSVSVLLTGFIHSLSFPTKKLAEDFLNTFKNFLVQAKELY